jgi:MerR family transcriptional regulator, thiopeptide resistance regulator
MPYRVRTFAALTGVTIKALQHYDRLGLLQPLRTAAGHRLYTASDRERLDRILALKALGIPLSRIHHLLAGRSEDVIAALRQQRLRLEDTRAQLDRAIRVVERIEGSVADPIPPSEAILEDLAAGLEMARAADALRQYFTPDAWARWGARHFDDWPPPAWRALYRDVATALDEDPAGERAEAFVARSQALWRAELGDDTGLEQSVRAGWMQARAAREQWPAPFRRRWNEFNIDRIARFLKAATWAAWERRCALHFAAGRRDGQSVA